MAGMIAMPAHGKWPREYEVQAEPPAKRVKVYPQNSYNFYPYDPVMSRKSSQERLMPASTVAYEDLYGTGGVPVPTPPPSIPVLHNTRSLLDGRSPVPPATDLDEPIRIKGGLGPKASHFCGAVTLLWFSMWPTAKKYLCTRESTQGIFDESRPRPEFVKYTRSLVEKADVSIEILSLSLLFLYRFREIRAKKDGKVPMNRYPTSEARVLVVALMTANKFLDDISYTTSTWSKMSGIDSQELKRMETEFLIGLDFNLHVSAKQWAAWDHLVPTILYPAVESLGRS